MRETKELAHAVVAVMGGGGAKSEICRAAWQAGDPGKN